MNIGKTLSRALHILPRFTDLWEMIVVDDGSVDKTAETAEKFRKYRDNIILIRHPVNRGYGALKSGITAARNDLIFFCDSDLQFDIGNSGSCSNGSELTVTGKALRVNAAECGYDVAVALVGVNKKTARALEEIMDSIPDEE